MKFILSPKTAESAIPYTDLVSRLESEFDGRMSVTDISEPDVDGMVAELIELKCPPTNDRRCSVRHHAQDRNLRF